MAASEKVDLVDEQDRVVGEATLGECLRKGLLHRAVAVLVVRTDGRMLLQRRSRRDMWHPGRWTLSCTGHVKKGETYRAGARRELLEELGLRSALRPRTKLLLPPIHSHGMTEREWVSLFTSNTDLEERVDPVEVDTVEDVSIARLRQMLLGRRLTPDAKTVLGAYLG